MANTTFNGPVRSENGFIDIAKDSLGNVITNMKLEQYTATVTVANGDTTGKESSIGMPTNFIPLACAVVVTVASTNSVNLDDVGSDADTDGYLDGIGSTCAVNSTGFKGFWVCNGALGFIDLGAGVVATSSTPDEVEVVLSGDPGAAGCTLKLKFFGISSTSDTA
jgi:hypothetical protein